MNKPATPDPKNNGTHAATPLLPKVKLPSDGFLAMLAAVLLPKDQLESLPGNHFAKDTLMRQAVDDAIRLFIFAKQRRSGIKALIEQKSTFISALAHFTTGSTMQGFFDTEVIPEWEKTAKRFEPAKKTDGLREYLKGKYTISFRNGAHLMEEIKKWRAYEDSPEWGPQLSGEQLNELYTAWLRVMTRPEYCLMGIRDCARFGQWKLGTEKENWRKRKAAERERKRKAKAKANNKRAKVTMAVKTAA